MKKLLVFVLALLLMTGLTGCGKDKISDDWTDLEFLLDGNKYSFPHKFLPFNSKGWLLEENDEIQPGEYTDEYYEIWNNSFYDEENQLYATILVEFENETDKVQNIKDCTIWWISFSRMPYLGVELNNVYEIELAKGIKWGSTEKEIIAAYGNVAEDKRIAVEEDGYVALIYIDETDNMYSQMILYILDDGGLFMVDLEKYPYE
ncbi:MAG: hypothetical protein WBI36_03000 [Erysipelotrichaceae bacterium]